MRHGAFAIPAAGKCGRSMPWIYRRLCWTGARRKHCRRPEQYCDMPRGIPTYEHKEAPVDAIITVVALHHIPDFWKAVAFKRMYDMLKPGGKLYLFDVIFSFQVESYREKFDNWVNSMRENAGQAMAEETIVHIRDEYSTFDWVIEGMIERAGFNRTEGLIFTA